MSAVTLLSARYTYALRSLKSIFCATWESLQASPKTVHVRHLNDHLAQDIGLTQAEIERHRLRLPSQNTHHPNG